MLVRTFQDGIEVMFCGKESAVNFRYVTPENEQDGNRLINFKNKFLQQNIDWACVDNYHAETVEKFDDAAQRDFLNKTKNRGVLWVSFKAVITAADLYTGNLSVQTRANAARNSRNG